jgi:acetyl esterase/lipase
VRDPRRKLTICLVVALAAVSASCVPAPPVATQRVTVPGTHGAGTPADIAGVAYGPHDAQQLDVYRSTGGASRGTIVFVHGGGFTLGHRSELVGGTHGLVLAQLRRGWDVVAVGYRLAPEHPFPAARDDLVLALRWLADHADEVGVQDARTVVVGHSAGGALAAMIGTTPGRATPAGRVPRVDAWVSIAGLSSFHHEDMLIDFPGDWGLESATQRSAAQPLTTLDAGDPPGHLIHGDLDRFVRDTHSTRLWHRGIATGARVTYDRITVGPRGCREHVPACGADRHAFERAID